MNNMNNVMIFLIVMIAFLIIMLLYCFWKLNSIKKQLSKMDEILEDMQTGNSKQKILMPPNEITSSLAYKINKMVYAYEEKIMHYKMADEGNRQLMTSLSHDVRTPLTTLIGYLDAVHKKIVTGNDYYDYIETARCKAHDLKDYIDILFDWFKLNSDDLILSMETVDISELTRNILKDWIPVFEEKLIEYDIEIPEKCIQVQVDADGYIRSINNLVQNVISHGQASLIRINVWEEEKRVKISVWDNGTGIAMEDLPFLFDRLYKCDKARSEKGSGLGLSIVKQLVEKMKGNITADSLQGEYTVFVIQFSMLE